MDSKPWSVSNAGVTSGPFSDDEVKSKLMSGEFQSDASIWKEGWSEWQPITSVFNDIPKSSPPPPPPYSPPTNSPAPAVDTKVSKLKKVIGLGCGGAILLMVILALLKPDSPPETSALGKSVAYLPELFNKAAEKVGSTARLQPVYFDAKNPTTFHQNFKERFYFMGTVSDNDQTLTDLLVLADPKAALKPDDEITKDFEATIATFSPELSTKERRQLIQDLGMLDGYNLHIVRTLVKNGVYYKFSDSDAWVMMLLISKTPPDSDGTEPPAP